MGGSGPAKAGPARAGGAPVGAASDCPAPVGAAPVGGAPVGPAPLGRVSRRLASSRLVWAGLVVLLGVGLAIGSGLGSGGGTHAQRISHLDSIIGCPSCTDLSVAESSASSAVAIRDFVSAQVDAGASDKAVETAVEAGYGASILLVPPASGINSLVWILPLVFVLLAIGAMIVVFRRRRGASKMTLSEEDRSLVEDALAGEALHQ